MMTDTLMALGEPNRFRIVEVLRAGARPVNDLAVALKLNQPQVSKHLRVLKDAGVVEVEPRGQQRLYQLRPEPLQELHAWIDGYRRLWEARFAGMDEVIEELQQKERRDARRKKE